MIIPFYYRNIITRFIIGYEIPTNLKICVIDYEKETRMKTSISSKAFCSITDRQTDEIFTE